MRKLQFTDLFKTLRENFIVTSSRTRYKYTLNHLNTKIVESNKSYSTVQKAFTEGLKEKYKLNNRLVTVNIIGA